MLMSNVKMCIECQCLLFLPQAWAFLSYVEKVRIKSSNIIYTILDPAYGRVCLTEKKMIEKWMIAEKGVAIVMSPKPDFLKNQR